MRVDPALMERKPEIYWNMLQTAEQVAKRYGIPSRRRTNTALMQPAARRTPQPAGQVPPRSCR